MVEGISVVITSSEAEGEGEEDLVLEPSSFSTADIFVPAGDEQVMKRKSARETDYLCERLTKKKR